MPVVREVAASRTMAQRCEVQVHLYLPEDPLPTSCCRAGASLTLGSVEGTAASPQIFAAIRGPILNGGGQRRPEVRRRCKIAHYCHLEQIMGSIP